MATGIGSIVQPDDYKARLAQMLAQQSFDTSPKGHWTQAAAQMAQALVAGNMMKDADAEQKVGLQSLLNAPGLGGGGVPAPAGGEMAPPPSFTGGAPAPAMAPTPPMPRRIYDQSEMNPLDAAVATNGELAAGVNAPRPYAPLIGKAAIDNDIPANVLAAQTKQESSFNPNAVSSAGAQGISQFMPGTAKDMGINPLDPAQAIPAQGQYMRQQLDKFGGDMSKALAAYNGGPGRLASVGGDINRMPAESQDYVRKILANAQPTVQTASASPQFAPSMPQPMAFAGQPAPAGPQMAQASTPAQAPQQPSAPTRSAVNIPPEQAAYIRQLITNPNTRAYGLELYSKFTGPTDSYEQVTAPNGQIIGQRSKLTGKVDPYPQADKPTFGEYDTDEFGKPKRGFIDASGRTITDPNAGVEIRNGNRVPLPGAPPSAAAPPAPSGVVRNPDGSMSISGVAVPAGADPKQARQLITESSVKNTLPAEMKDTAELRKEVMQSPSYKNYAQAMPIYRSMAATADTNTKASDLNLVYGLGKIMDPGSVVREGEMVMVKQTGSLPDWVVGTINGVNGGQTLTPETRAAILAEAHNRMKSYEDAYSLDANHYKGVASRNRMNPDDVIPAFESAKPWKPAAKPGAAPNAAPAESATAFNPKTGERVILKDGKWVPLT